MNTSQLSPYLNFNGNCEEAMTFYQSVFGGELTFNRFGDFASPEMPVDDADKNKVMHADLKNGALSFMASDGAPGRAVAFGDSISMSLAGQDETQLTDFFTKLSEGGTVTMPLAQQMWGDMFGMLTDKYGIHWTVNISINSANIESSGSAV